MEETKQFNEIESESVEYVIGYVAHRFFHKYPFLKSDEESSKDSWIQHLSMGNLTVPSRTLVNAAHTMESLFKDLHGNGLSKHPNIIKNIVKKLNEKFHDLPTDVLGCLVRTRTFIRMNKLNNKLLNDRKTTKTKNNTKVQKFIK